MNLSIKSGTTMSVTLQDVTSVTTSDFLIISNATEESMVGPIIGTVSPHKVTHFLWTYIPPFVILLGTAGNVLSFSVMLRKKLSDTPMSLCLRLLAIIDTAVLWTGYFRYWLWKTFSFDIRDQHDITCKGHAMIVCWTTQYASWILICIALDRFFVVYASNCAQRACTKFRMGIYLFCIGVALLLVNSHFIWTVHLDNKGTKGWKCSIIGNDSSKTFMEDIWPWLDQGIYSLIPFIFISVCNACIIINLCLQQKKTSVKSTSTRHFLTRGRVNTMAYTLLIISCAFILTTLPITIFMIIKKLKVHDLNANEELCFALGNFLCYLNSASNFILYCISSSYFRRELNMMLSCGRKAVFGGSLSDRPRLSLQNINEGSSMNRHEQAYDQLVTADEPRADL